MCLLFASADDALRAVLATCGAAQGADADYEVWADSATAATIANRQELLGVGCDQCVCLAFAEDAADSCSEAKAPFEGCYAPSGTLDGTPQFAHHHHWLFFYPE